MKVESFISEYETQFKKAEENEIKYPEYIKGFMVIEGVNLTSL